MYDLTKIVRNSNPYTSVVRMNKPSHKINSYDLLTLFW